MTEWVSELNLVSTAVRVMKLQPSSCTYFVTCERVPLTAVRSPDGQVGYSVRMGSESGSGCIIVLAPRPLITPCCRRTVASVIITRDGFIYSA